MRTVLAHVTYDGVNLDNRVGLWEEKPLTADRRKEGRAVKALAFSRIFVHFMPSKGDSERRSSASTFNSLCHGSLRGNTFAEVVLLL